MLGGETTTIADGVVRIVAPNPGPMTGPGTNTYLIGQQEIAVIDPGPYITSHVEQILNRCDRRLKWILTTHTHPDHSPGAAILREHTQAQVMGIPAPKHPPQDQTFAPDKSLAHDQVIRGSDFEIRVIHTPGHASNHVCFLHQDGWLFTGDHIMNGSTVVINPPDGNMKDYLASLALLQTLPLKAICPGHGEVIKKPQAEIEWIIQHRLDREAMVRATVEANPDSTLEELVPLVYTGIDPRLYPWAARSLLAHLIKLTDDCVVIEQAKTWRLMHNADRD